MSIMAVHSIVDRIKLTHPSSKLAVFKCSKDGYLNCVFANTVKTQQLIREKDASFIGVFDEKSVSADLRKLLDDAAYSAPKK